MVSKSKKEIRVRIAPSPTGYFHIGTARTALFNYLFARQNGGVFILRIEDTDLERSDKKFEEDIFDGLKWLGLEWDEGPVIDTQSQKSRQGRGSPEAAKVKSQNYIGKYGPYRQTERLDIYEKYINQLLDKNLAYYCFCSKEDLEAERQAMMTQGLAPKYSGRCRTLKPEEIQEKLHSNTSRIIRLKMPESKITFKDLIRGSISFDTGLIGDIAIAKDTRTPLYNFAVVIDDYEMKISHVIRGEDHVANTPKQIAIQKALDLPQPHYAHLPLILDSDRHKMSKRFSAASLKEYREEGYLPQAMINFMALLGWHSSPEQMQELGFSPDREIFNLDELVRFFNLKRVQKAGAIFNIDKLNWLNAQYLKFLKDKDLAELLKVKNVKIIALVRDRMKKISDFQELAGSLLNPVDYSFELLIWKDSPKEVILDNLKESLRIFSATLAVDFNQESLNKTIGLLAEQRGKGEVFWPIRAALSGKKNSPGPLEIAEAIGKKETIKRIETAIKKLSN
ncbi:MAG: glutamate--tRNA ligase [Candidatus Harrisonbacteria bacterium RIFCSPLOWO2_02_FULL_41_13b]|uniref:Glutamate--tRNA ligase n=1 Tax=Candidatus Harrisonbacteria bacterium RIFCSPLOWO2_02_FULL_41_13b TaxID=1798409 RepID=A0A1G1ZSP3_9BACT|nr:MAG: glutamate--tRNA ligase [Candidatus Harrisonbacteria bacterium RIFCSPHIGHO2_02_FULL_40_20]OGY67572.1 MAG: glutamate--tRNA ligase [Candidatus Harrisonbacteria bacterium RIFCSPLOWO2_02_FULL_41_13b]